MIGIEWSEKMRSGHKNSKFLHAHIFQLCSFGIENMIVSGHLDCYLIHFEWVW
jgi:hypothetical protein